MHETLQDLRFAARMLMRNPIITIVAAVTLALGVGANTAIFTVVHDVLIRPLPYPEPGNLVQVWRTDRESAKQEVVGPLNFRDFLERTGSIEEGGLYGYNRYVLTGLGEPERIRGISVTSGFFRTLRVNPIAGRWFTEADDLPGTHNAIVSEEFWRNRLNADPAAVGGSLVLDGETYAIVGVMPSGFAFPSRIDLWTTLAPDYARISRGSHYLFAIARIRTGQSIDAVRAESGAVMQALEQENPNTNGRLTFAFVPLQQQIVGNAQGALIALLVAVGFVLLIACANVVNIMLARASSRTTEIAVRRALGAGNRRLTRQFLAEGLLLAGVGGFAGLLVAAWGVDLLVSLDSSMLPRAAEVRFDAGNFLFAFAIMLFVAIALGLAQSWAFARYDAAMALREGGRGASSTRRRNRARDVLAVAQIALALPLLAGATLLLRTVYELNGVTTGFDAEHLLTMDVSVGSARYPDGQRQIDYANSLLDHLTAIPGVAAAGIVNDLPFAGSRSWSSFQIAGREPMDPSPDADARVMTPGYPAAMGIDIVRGRNFTADDRSGTPSVVLINQAFADRFFPDQDPIGQHLETRPESSMEIVGIVENIIHDDLTTSPNAEYYVPFAQEPLGRMFLAIRTSGDPAALATAARSAVLAVDPEQPAFAVQTMRHRLEQSIAPQRSTLLLLTLFAVVAVTLAIVGLYGVIAFSVAQRYREMGIRIALGARPDDISRLVLRQAIGVIAIGLVSGVVAAIAVARSLRSLLFGVSAADPLTLLAVSILLAFVALTASWLPARRATRADPIRILRQE
jgi:putative ABC transport system permease protein